MPKIITKKEKGRVKVSVSKEDRDYKTEELVEMIRELEARVKILEKGGKNNVR